MDADTRAISQVWQLYYDQEAEFKPGDKRLVLVLGFVEWFRDTGKPLLKDIDWRTVTVVYFSYDDFRAKCPYSDFSGALREEPEDVLKCLGLALCVIRADMLGSMMGSISPAKITPRMQNVSPLTSIRDLKSNSVGKFVSVRGNVVRVSAVRPLVLRMSFMCVKCGTEVPCWFMDGKYEQPTACGDKACRARSFAPLYGTATTVDWQKVRIQELEGDITDTGRVPRTLECELSEDLVDGCVPGDVVTISGIVKAIETDVAAGKGTSRAKSLFLLYVDARSVTTHKATERGVVGQGGAASSTSDAAGRGGVSKYFSERDMEFFARIKLHPDPFSLIVASACPQIFGHEVVKAGLLLGLFGGTPRNVSATKLLGAGGAVIRENSGQTARSGTTNGHTSAHPVVPTLDTIGADTGFERSSGKLHVRSDPHVLVVGDPGMGKSQMLQAVSGLAPRGVYVCGNTTSTTGLTVTMVRDAITGDYGLEAGALVLGDQGICCIDEFDKMTAEHSALLEAMEQQRISIAKAGIVSSLSARTSVLAAANPVGGHYNKGKTIVENLKMSAPLLSRFDLIFILLDKPDELRDRQLSEHVMAMHDTRNPVPPASRVSANAVPQTPTTQIVTALTQRPRVLGEDEVATTAPVMTQAAHARAVAVAALRETQNHGAPALHGRAPLGGPAEERLPLDVRLRRGVMSIPPPQIVPPPLLRKYVAYARRYCYPALLPEAAEVLQAFYLSLRKQHGSGDSTPITTRQLESLIRLAEARSKIELREYVTKQDAEDVVDMMKESLFEAVTDDFGVVDFGRSSGMSMGRQVKLFVAALNKAAGNRGSARFTTEELERFARDMRLQLHSFPDFLEILNQQSYIIRKGPREWQLLSSGISQH